MGCGASGCLLHEDGDGVSEIEALAGDHRRQSLRGDLPVVVEFFRGVPGQRRMVRHRHAVCGAHGQGPIRA